LAPPQLLLVPQASLPVAEQAQTPQGPVAL
jgi:hypothetical protein